MIKYGVDPLAEDVAGPQDRQTDPEDFALAKRRREEEATKVAHLQQADQNPYDRHLESLQVPTEARAYFAEQRRGS